MPPALRSACWLMVCTYLAVPMALPAQSWIDVSAQTGLGIAAGSYLPYGHGACSGDFDADGDEDLMIAGGSSVPLQLYRNDGNLLFTEMAFSLPPVMGSNLRGMVATDIDNDGDLDVTVCRQGAPNMLLVNDGSGAFTNQGIVRGIGYAGPSWMPLYADYDRDGWLDLFVGTYLDLTLGASVSNRIYRNNGNGWFTDVTGTTGLEDAQGLFYAGAWFDHDEDGWPDLLLANDKGVHPSFAPGSLYRNNGNGTFSDIGASAQCLLPIDGMGADVVDLFNDGGWEAYVTDSPVDHVVLSLDPATATYTDVASSLGIAGGPGLLGWGVHFLDSDNDGWQDIHVVHHGNTNALYLNPGTSGAPWVDVAGAAGCNDSSIQYSVVVADFDDDGGLDLLNLFPTTAGFRFLRSVGANGSWLKVKTEGTISNRDGLGAIVEVTAGGITQRQHVRTSRGYLTGSDRRTHFGLGGATQAEVVVVRWPSGAIQRFHGVAANQVFTCREPSIVPLATPAAGQSTVVTATFPGEAGRGYLLGLSLGSQPGLALPDGRTLPMNFDQLLAYVLNPNPLFWPTSGTLSSPAADATAPLFLPWGSQGVSLSLAAVSLDAAAPWGAASISAPLGFLIL